MNREKDMKNKDINSDLKYFIELKKDSNTLTTLFFGIVILVWIIILIPFSYGVISTCEFDSFALADLILFIFRLFIIDQFLWQINGKEIILISDGIQIHKTGKLFKMKTQIEISKIESISYINDNQTMKFEEDYLYRGGKIKIQTKNRYIRIG